MHALRLVPIARPARAAWILGRILGRGSVATFDVFGGRRIDVPLDDGYWISRLLLDGDYEPEVGAVLARTLRPQDAFIDCGANIGWWSIFASSVVPDAARILAVEPARAVFARLQAAAESNRGAFVPLRAAVWDRSGLELTLIADRDRHAAASVAATPEGSAARGSPEPVTSITIDELIERVGATPRVIVKLDVEGSEPEALAGAGRLAGRDALLIYEDHGRDRASRNTATVLAQGWKVFWYEPAGGMHVIEDAADVAARKRDRDRGYNLVACRPGTPIHELLVEWAQLPQKPVP
jgi:FkbM family methyltransferase